VIACRHKPTAARIWFEAGLRELPALPFFADDPYHANVAANTFGLPFWLRSSVGAGAKCATLVEDVKTAFHWAKYWESRGETVEWVAEEYLPGRDFCWTGVYRRGILYASFARERLEWLYPHLSPSGRTGTPTVAVTVHDERVNETAKRAVEAVDSEPNGVYGVDLREDRAGVPRPTEINAGRFPTTSPLYHELGPNLVDLYVRLGAGEAFEPWGDDIYPAGIQLLRHIDCGHVWRSKHPDAQDDRDPSQALQFA
jgi:carbamoyl-phosphate synthase large subunit